MAGRVPLRVCLFSGASSLPTRIADHLGLLAEAGLAADLHLTRGSRELVEGLLAADRCLTIPLLVGPKT